MMTHQYIERPSGRVMEERLLGDRWVQLLYGPVRENAPALFRHCTQARLSALLGALHFDLPGRITGARAVRKLAASMRIPLDECVCPPETFITARHLFERRIRYWETRPMPAAEDLVVSPADARVLPGSLEETDMLFIKEKFFTLPELFGGQAEHWVPCFAGGAFAVFRLTPDKYHYNHAPVSGNVLAIFEEDGLYHSCNPGATMAVASPLSRNKRVVTVIDTDVPGGTQVGKVAMIEVVALMIGRIEQCYSREGYQDPRPVVPGLFLERGQPKSLYRPGSSTDVLLFEPRRIRFAPDLVANRRRPDVQSRFSIGLGDAAVETEVRVREEIACRC
jgi:phosphatidylserine decarboxylase